MGAKNIFKKEVFLSWLWVVLCFISILVIVPVANTFQRFVSDNFGSEAFIYFVLFALAIAFVFIIYLLIYKLKIRSLTNYVWLFTVAGFYIYSILKLRNAPAEAVHLLEYGLLGFFLFKALIHHVRDKSLYFTASFFALLIGTFDEILQWITPQRMWDFRDVGLNALSGGLFQLGIWKVVKPKIISDKINANSIRILTSVFAICLVILGLCASNTPKRVASYTKLLPWLSFLRKEEPMSEFGNKFGDPEIGVFYSRLRLGELEKIDKQKGEEYAHTLNDSANMSYEQFLREYNPISNPFLHELRIHIFRRDTSFDKGNKTSDINEKKELYFIAYKENLILEKYFTRSVGKSAYSWGENKIKALESLIDKSKPYKSPVSANLITSFSEKTMWISIFAIISLLILLNLIFSKKQRKAINP